VCVRFALVHRGRTRSLDVGTDKPQQQVRHSVTAIVCCLFSRG
jgi:hypothetical protein